MSSTILGKRPDQNVSQMKEEINTYTKYNKKKMVLYTVFYLIALFVTINLTFNISLLSFSGMNGQQIVEQLKLFLASFDKTSFAVMLMLLSLIFSMIKVSGTIEILDGYRYNTSFSIARSINVFKTKNKKFHLFTLIYAAIDYLLMLMTFIIHPIIIIVYLLFNAWFLRLVLSANDTRDNGVIDTIQENRQIFKGTSISFILDLMLYIGSEIVSALFLIGLTAGAFYLSTYLDTTALSAPNELGAQSMLWHGSNILYLVLFVVSTIKIATKLLLFPTKLMVFTAVYYDAAYERWIHDYAPKAKKSIIY